LNTSALECIPYGIKTPSNYSYALLYMIHQLLHEYHI